MTLYRAPIEQCSLYCFIRYASVTSTFFMLRNETIHQLGRRCHSPLPPSTPSPPELPFPTIRKQNPLNQKPRTNKNRTADKIAFMLCSRQPDPTSGLHFFRRSFFISFSDKILFLSKKKLFSFFKHSAQEEKSCSR